MPEIEYELIAEVGKVEERFRKAYDKEKVGNAKTEGQMADAAEEVSIGWFVVLKGYGIAFRFGDSKPDIQPGDTLVLAVRKIPKAPPALEVVPPPKPTAPTVRDDVHTAMSPEAIDEALAKHGYPLT